MTPEQTDGLTKARLVCNASRAAEDRFDTNEAYAAWVCQMAGIDELPATALDSYAEQHAASSIADLEAALEQDDA